MRRGGGKRRRRERGRRGGSRELDKGRKGDEGERHNRVRQVRPDEPGIDPLASSRVGLILRTLVKRSQIYLLYLNNNRMF